VEPFEEAGNEDTCAVCTWPWGVEPDMSFRCSHRFHE
jgi:hypothetical protein